MCIPKRFTTTVNPSLVLKQFQVSALSSFMLLASGSVVAAADDKPEHNSHQHHQSHKKGKDHKKDKDHKQRTSEHSLKTVKVTADSITTDFKVDKVSSDKFTQPLVDTPQTIVVVKKELFQQQAATTLSETLRNTPGITLLLGENGNTATGDSIFMRGFDTQGSIFVDGIRDLGSISRDTFNTEQVEIAKGPAGVDNGRGAASGYVNLSSKLANLDEAGSGVMTVGTGDYKRASVDLNRTLGDTSAVRINLMKQDAGVAGRDHVQNNSQGLAASLGYGLGTDTRYHLNLLAMQQSGIPDGGIPTIGIEGYYDAIFDSRPSSTYKNGGPLAGITPKAVDTANFYGSLDDENDVNAHMTSLRVEHDLSDKATLRNITRIGRTQQDLSITGVNGLAAPVATLQDTSTWQATRTRHGRDQTNQIFANQTNLNMSFEAAGVKHELASGVEFLYESQTNNTVGTAWQTAKPESRVDQAKANLYNPSTSDVFQPLMPDGSKTEGSTTTTAFYALDTITLNDQWELSAGLRAERYHTTTNVIARQGKVTAPASQTVPIGTLLGRSAEVTDELLSWKLGGVYKPAENGSIYVSYATSQLPPGGANFALNTDSSIVNANSANVDPQKGTNKEIGTKWNVYNNKLALTAALFSSTNDNEITTNPDGSTTAVGARRVEGVEVGVSGIVMQNWQINAGFAYMEPEITRGAQSLKPNSSGTISTTDGGVIQWSPKVTFTLWNSYTFNNGVILAGGARYMDSVASSSLTDAEARSRRSVLTVPDYWVIDAMASYPINKNITLQLNLFNLADETYVASLNSGGSRYSPGASRSARVGLNFTF